ncbi:MAG: hypothetical protein IPI88_15580 [Chitinophagaceae bacterium]|nr:hypothetical protein [Chitinophagaceae bacterium]
MPNSFVIVCAAGAVATMSAYGQPFPLPVFLRWIIPGDSYLLRSPQSRIIHAVSYAIPGTRMN